MQNKEEWFERLLVEISINFTGVCCQQILTLCLYSTFVFFLFTIFYILNVILNNFSVSCFFGAFYGFSIIELFISYTLWCQLKTFFCASVSEWTAPATAEPWWNFKTDSEWKSGEFQKGDIIYEWIFVWLAAPSIFTRPPFLSFPKLKSILKLILRFYYLRWWCFVMRLKREVSQK